VFKWHFNLCVEEFYVCFDLLGTTLSLTTDIFQLWDSLLGFYSVMLSSCDAWLPPACVGEGSCSVGAKISDACMTKRARKCATAVCLGTRGREELCRAFPAGVSGTIPWGDSRPTGMPGTMAANTPNIFLFL
jgi:hypothetical protein